MASESSFFVFCAAFVSISIYVGSHFGPSHAASGANASRGMASQPADTPVTASANEPPTVAEAQAQAAARALQALVLRDTRTCHQYLSYGITVVSDRMGTSDTPASAPDLGDGRIRWETGDPDMEVVLAYMTRRATARPIPPGAAPAEAWMHDLLDDSLRFCLGYFEQKHPETLR